MHEKNERSIMTQKDMRPAWQAVNSRPRIMLDTETIMENPMSIYEAGRVEVNEVDMSDITNGIDEVFDQAEARKMDLGPLDDYVMRELPKVCDATAEDVSGLIVGARFFAETDESLIERMRHAAIDAFARTRYTVELVDMDGAAIGTIATIKNVSDDRLAEAVGLTLKTFGYEITDDESDALKRTDPWNLSTIDRNILQHPVAVGQATKAEDRKWQMDHIGREAFMSPNIEAVMMNESRLDAYGEYGLNERKVGAITTFDHEANLPRDIGDGMVIGFDQPMFSVKIVDAVNDRAGGGRRIQDTLEANGAHGSFTETRVEVDDLNGDEDPWMGEEESDVSTEDVNPWQNIAMETTTGPEIS